MKNYDCTGREGAREGEVLEAGGRTKEERCAGSSEGGIMKGKGERKTRKREEKTLQSITCYCNRRCSRE